MTAAPDGKKLAEKLEIFDILVNDADEVLIAIDARETEPTKARVLLKDGGILLIRNSEDAVFMPNVPDNIQTKIKVLPDVLVAEADEKGLVRDYAAVVRKAN